MRQILTFLGLDQDAQDATPRRLKLVMCYRSPLFTWELRLVIL